MQELMLLETSGSGTNPGKVIQESTPKHLAIQAGDETQQQSIYICEIWEDPSCLPCRVPPAVPLLARV